MIYKYSYTAKLAAEQHYSSSRVIFVLWYRLLKEILHISRLLYCAISCKQEHALISNVSVQDLTVDYSSCHHNFRRC